MKYFYIRLFFARLFQSLCLLMKNMEEHLKKIDESLGKKNMQKQRKEKLNA